MSNLLLDTYDWYRLLKYLLSDFKKQSGPWAKIGIDENGNLKKGFPKLPPLQRLVRNIKLLLIKLKVPQNLMSNAIVTKILLKEDYEFLSMLSPAERVVLSAFRNTFIEYCIDSALKSDHTCSLSQAIFEMKVPNREEFYLVDCDQLGIDNYFEEYDNNRVKDFTAILREVYNLK